MKIMQPEDGAETPRQMLPARLGPVQGLVPLYYLAPILLLGVVYFPIDHGGYVFWRNLIRAGCGPVAAMMAQAGFELNDLATYATAFGLIWAMWFLALFSSPLHRLPLAVHVMLGFLWCFGGFCLTIAI